MERKNFKYSLKNIPVPSEDNYMKTMITKVESLIKRMRWKVFFFDKKNQSEAATTNSYGFNSEKAPPQSNALIPFENDLYNMLSSITFTKRRPEFQKQLSRDLREIRASDSLFVPADKTTNLYKLPPDVYSKLLHNNVTSSYQIANADAQITINREANRIAKKLDLNDRIEQMAEKPAFITLKDHKENFENNPKCRLLNPAKSEIGVISRHRLQAINESIREHTGLKQWRNTQTVLSWFRDIKSKKQSRFIQLDIVDFYPSISEELLKKSIEYARSITIIDDETVEIVLHARKSLLFSDGKAWSKKDGSLFDVTMGSFDGAEICELVGLFLLHQVEIKFPEIDFGLYRDDGLGCYKRMPGPRAERIKKDMIKLFKENGLSITIIMNATVANFLDSTMNLASGKHSPYRKPNDTPLYIHKHSNHPPNITKQLPVMIQTRLSDLSSDAHEFNNVKSDYETALSNSGFHDELKFAKSKPKSKRNRKRNIIWFNPPYNVAVTNNIGREFTSLIDKHFPPHHKYRKIFNRSNLRLSYSCTTNVKTIILNHNKKILSKPIEHVVEKLCNCRRKDECPLGGECLQPAITYRATVNAGDARLEKLYTGATEPPWKERYRNHNCSFEKPYRRSESSLSKYVWKLKDDGFTPNVSWSIDTKSFPYRCGTRKCDLCLTEKLAILRNAHEKKNTLNTRSEIMNKCRHTIKFKLSSVR